MQAIKLIKGLLVGLIGLIQALHALVVAVEHVENLANSQNRVFNSNAFVDRKKCSQI